MADKQILYTNGPYLRHSGEGFICDYTGIVSRTKLTSATHHRLNLLQDTFGIVWETCYVVKVKQYKPYAGRSIGTATSALIVGKLGKHTIEYQRKETKAKGAGSTSLLLNGRHRILATSLDAFVEHIQAAVTDNLVRDTKWRYGWKSKTSNRNLDEAFIDVLLTNITISEAQLAVMLVGNDEERSISEAYIKRRA